MKVGVVSDLHANLPAWEKVYGYLVDRVDRIICAGDVVGYYPFPNEVVESLRSHDVFAVKGNHDAGVLGETSFRFNAMARQALRWSQRELTDDNLQFLRERPLQAWLNLGGIDVHLVHGSPQRPLTHYVSTAELGGELFGDSSEIPDLLVMGHTHLPYYRVVDDTAFLNPGSVGQPRDGDPRASCAIWDTEEFDVRHVRLSYDIDATAAKTKEALPDALAARLHSGR